MSIHAIDLIWKRSEHKGSNLLVLLAVADHADPEDGTAYPGIDHLAQKTRLTPRAVRYALKKVLETKELDLLERGGRRGGKPRANLYRVNYGYLQTLPLRVDPKGQSDAAPIGNGLHPNRHKKPSVSTPTPSWKDRATDLGFFEWLEDHERVTGHKPPGPKTKALRALATSFGVLRGEGRSLRDLKLATRGAHADSYRRENGYDVAESILKPTKVQKLINWGTKVTRDEPAPSETPNQRAIRQLREQGRHEEADELEAGE